MRHSPRSALGWLAPCAACALWIAIAGCRTPAKRPATVDETDGTAGEAAHESTGESTGESAGYATAEGSAPATAGDSSSFPIHGSLNTRYRGRFTSGAHDHDLYELVTVDIGDSEKNRVSGHLVAGGAADLDGGTDGNNKYIFQSLADTYDHSVTGRLYRAYADVRSVGPFERVRIGRQLDYLTPEVAWFDGVSVLSPQSSEHAVQYGVYGGVPVHQYESSSHGDRIFGTFAEARPWKSGRWRFDWMHLEDEQTLGTQDDDLLGLGWWQNVGREVRVESAYTRVENRDRDVLVRATWQPTENDLMLQASFYRLLTTQRDLASELDPFFNTLLDLFPYSQIRALFSKGLTEHVNLQTGVDLRRVSDDDDEGQFNRDFERYFATAIFDDLLPAGLSLSVTGEVWDSDASDITTGGLELSKHWNKVLDAGLGSSYALYKYDLYSNQERDDVRTYYAMLRYKSGSRWTVDVRYEYEDDDQSFQTLRTGATWRF